MSETTAAAASPRTLDELIERAPIATLVVNAQCRIIRMNPRAGAVLSRGNPVTGEYLDEVARRLWPDRDAARLVGAVRKVLETGTAQRIALTGGADGEVE